MSDRDLFESNTSLTVGLTGVIPIVLFLAVLTILMLLGF